MIALPVLGRDAVLEGLKWFFRDGESTGSEFVLRIPAALSGGRTVDRIDAQEIDASIARLQQAKTRTESSFQWEKSAEFSLLSLNENNGLLDFLEEDQNFGQNGNPITFSIGKPSPDFAAYLLCLLMQYPESSKSPRWRFLRNRVATYLKEGEKSRQVRRLTGSSLLDVVAQFMWVTTLKISSEKERSDFEVLANSFLFHAAYNTDAAARIGLDPTFYPSDIQRIRRAQGDTFDAPRQSYESDLVHHYLMGVAAEIPLLEYLSYYHIAEHFYEKVFNDDLVKQVREGITDPSFSVRRARDVQGVINIVMKVQRQVKEEGGVNEQRALKLVLDKFVKVPRLIADLNAYDSSLIDYYAKTEVQFAGAGKVNLRDTDEEIVRSAVAKRIYKVRNALVHAKDGELPKYAPFAHDGELAREMPLMRFAAEQIVIAHGKPL